MRMLVAGLRRVWERKLWLDFHASRQIDATPKVPTHTTTNISLEPRECIIVKSITIIISMMTMDLEANIKSCLDVAATLETTLGPCGMDKLLIDRNNNILVSNDGATILRHLAITHPTGRLLVEASRSQVWIWPNHDACPDWLLRRKWGTG